MHFFIYANFLMNIEIRDTSAPLFALLSLFECWGLRFIIICVVSFYCEKPFGPLSVDARCVISPPSSFELLLPMCSRFLLVSFALAPIKRRFLTTKILPHANFPPSSIGFFIFQRKWDFYGRIFRYLLLTVFMEVKRNLELCCLENPIIVKVTRQEKSA